MFKIIHYRNKCIGCAICFEQQPEVWRMSKKDGKATLINAQVKKDIYHLIVNEEIKFQSQEIAKACPAKIIKTS
jgi:ferredoxin